MVCMHTYIYLVCKLHGVHVYIYIHKYIYIHGVHIRNIERVWILQERKQVT